MAAKRHTKFNNTVYHLEPNIKEAPGGFRDIHLLHWMALLAHDKGRIQEALDAIDGPNEILNSCALLFAFGIQAR